MARPTARRFPRWLTMAALGVAAGLGSTLVIATPAAATAPQTPHFGRSIEPHAAYDGQDTCDPTAKPGVVSFRDMLNRTYGTHNSGIVRACNVGGQSEHKEGRALDYTLHVNKPAEFAIANDILDWLLSTDVYGNRDANARRLGVMYIIYNRRIWQQGSWKPYHGDNPHTDHIHVSFSWAGARRQTSWWSGGTNISVYGVLADGRLTYSAIESGTGDFIKVTRSDASLGFTPKAMATLNFNTLLITSTGGQLYRVDIRTNRESVVFDPPVLLEGGWTHDLLTFDGAGHLFGIADGVLIRYNVNAAKPGAGNISSGTRFGPGFTLKTLAASGPNWIIGTANGRLRAYRITGGDWTGYTLRESGWGGFTHLLSPGAGLYLGRTADSGMYHYYDVSPFDGNGDDITYYNDDPVNERGWTQILLSAQPFTT